MATIIQKVIFQNATIEQLYNLYMDPKLHEIISGGTVKISEKHGSTLDVFDGYITGKTLQTVKNKLVVQSWFGSDWNETDTMSAFVLSFEQNGNDAIVNVFHANVPDDKVTDLDKGWYDFYWNPWKAYLSDEKK